MESNKSKGLGDSIAKFTSATGIKKLADKIPGGCGCKARQEALNRMFPYGDTKEEQQGPPAPDSTGRKYEEG